MYPGQYPLPKRLTLLIFVAGTLLSLTIKGASAEIYSEQVCGELKNAYGPFDYRMAPPDQRYLVEGAHFKREVETLIRGVTAQYPGGDIDYTLRAFPNHPRALAAMMKLGSKEKTEKPRGAKWSIACYFARALQFQPDDMDVRMVYAMYLHRTNRIDQAIKELEEVHSQRGDDANLFYNLGLMYLDKGDPERSLGYAHKAYRMGFQLDGLKNRLKKIGRWSEMQKVVPAVPTTAEAELDK